MKVADAQLRRLLEGPKLKYTESDSITKKIDTEAISISSTKQCRPAALFQNKLTVLIV